MLQGAGSGKISAGCSVVTDIDDGKKHPNSKQTVVDKVIFAKKNPGDEEGK